VAFRSAGLDDLDALVRIRAAEWGTIEYWERRIGGYLAGELHPREALPPRTVVAAFEADRLVGFAAAHQSRRLGCDGELEWLNVDRPRRGRGIAARLLVEVAAWFVQRDARRVCVDPDREARAFYVRHGAVPLNPHWLVWPDIGELVNGPGHDRVHRLS
jgi:GNAT superfamily N-acetyltransferase